MKRFIVALACIASAAAAVDTCNSTALPCSSTEMCAYPWAPSHENHYRTCDTDTGKCIPNQCGRTLDGSMKRCPMGSICQDFKCYELKTNGQSCDNSAEWEYDDDCFGEWSTCFSNGTTDYKCASVDEFRGRECGSDQNCPSPLRCYASPDGTSKCTHSDRDYPVWVKEGDKCESTRFACLGDTYGSLGRGYCQGTLQSALLADPAASVCAALKVANPAAKAACPAARTECTSGAQCDSRVCADGSCVDSSLLIGEACVDNNQCISRNCTANACAPGINAKSDCRQVECPDDRYCYSYLGDSVCYPYCGNDGEGEVSWDSEFGGFLCDEVVLLANGEACPHGRHYNCQSGHCYRFNISRSECVDWAINEAPVGTLCNYPSASDERCASKLCGQFTGVCIASGVAGGAACGGGALDQCDFDFFCGDDGSESLACLPMSSSAEDSCTGGHPSEFDTSCGSATHRGTCVCKDETSFDCVDRRSDPRELLEWPRFSYDYVHYAEFSYDAFEVLGMAGCDNNYPASLRDVNDDSRVNKCVKQIRSRLDSPNSELEFDTNFVFPMEIDAYSIRQIVGDLDGECRSMLAGAVCCAACGLVSDNGAIPSVSRHTLSTQHVWTSAAFKGWATAYLDLDCGAPTIHPVWDACSPSDEAMMDMTVAEWADSIGACDTGSNGSGVSSTPDPSGDLDAGQQLEGGCAGSALIAAIMAVGAQ